MVVPSRDEKTKHAKKSSKIAARINIRLAQEGHRGKMSELKKVPWAKRQGYCVVR